MDDIIVKYLTRQASKAEKRVLFEWIEKDPVNQDYFIEQKKIFAFYPSKLNVDKEKSWKIIENRSFKTIRIRKNMFSLMKYAAVLAISLIVFKYAESLKNVQSEVTYHSLTVADGQIEKVSLNDGSLVWLNSGSVLKIPSDFSAINRTVIIEGQAYFEVEHDISSPFIVETEHSSIRVLGTKFNLNAYDPNFLEATLIEGKIQFYAHDKLSSELVPGEKLTYFYSDQSIETERLENTDFYSSWSTGTLSFDRISLVNLTDILERWYKVDFVFLQNELKQMKFSGTLIKDDALEQSLNLFQCSSDLTFRISGKNSEIIEILGPA